MRSLIMQMISIVSGLMTIVLYFPTVFQRKANSSNSSRFTWIIITLTIFLISATFVLLEHFDNDSYSKDDALSFLEIIFSPSSPTSSSTPSSNITQPPANNTSNSGTSENGENSLPSEFPMSTEPNTSDYDSPSINTETSSPSSNISDTSTEPFFPPTDLPNFAPSENEENTPPIDPLLPFEPIFPVPDLSITGDPSLPVAPDIPYPEIDITDDGPSWYWEGDYIIGTLNDVWNSDPVYCTIDDIDYKMADDAVETFQIFFMDDLADAIGMECRADIDSNGYIITLEVERDFIGILEEIRYDASGDISNLFMVSLDNSTFMTFDLSETFRDTYRDILEAGQIYSIHFDIMGEAVALTPVFPIDPN